jgi:anthranilate synthase component 1
MVCVHDHPAATTSREAFCLRAGQHRVVPVTRKVLTDAETPLSAYRKLAANRPGTFLLEAAETLTAPHPDRNG